MLISPLEVLGGAIPILSFNNGQDAAGNQYDPAANLRDIASAITTGDYGYFFGEPADPPAEPPAQAPGTSALDFANSLAQLKAQASASTLAQLLSDAAPNSGEEPAYSFFLNPAQSTQSNSAAALAALLSLKYGDTALTARATTLNLLG